MRACVCVWVGVHVGVLVCMHVVVIHWMHGSVASTHCKPKEELCSAGSGGEPRSAEDLRVQLSQVGNNFAGALMTSASFTMMAAGGTDDELV